MGINSPLFQSTGELIMIFIFKTLQNAICAFALFLPLGLKKIHLAALLFFSTSIGFAASNFNWELSFNGLGPIKIGMTLQEAEKVSDIKLNSNEQNNECFIAKPEGFKGLSFMVVDGRIARVDVSSDEFATGKGTRVGDSEAMLKESYKETLKTEPHKYIENGHYFTLENQEDHTAIQFDTDGSKIISIHSGGADAVYLVEGCY